MHADFTPGCYSAFAIHHSAAACNMISPQRIMIIGQPGSGKSTLARALGRLTQLPVEHIDKIHWQTGWIERPGAEKDRLCAAVHAREQWIFEGGRSSTWPERLARADMLIWLDFPLWLRAWRVTWRTVRYYGQSRPDLPPGCPERFNWEFTRWIWDTRHSGRNAMQVFFDNAAGQTRRHRLSSALQVSRFLQEIENESRTTAETHN